MMITMKIFMITLVYDELQMDHKKQVRFFGDNVFHILLKEYDHHDDYDENDFGGDCDHDNDENCDKMRTMIMMMKIVIK